MGVVRQNFVRSLNQCDRCNLLIKLGFAPRHIGCSAMDKPIARERSALDSRKGIEWRDSTASISCQSAKPARGSLPSVDENFRQRWCWDDQGSPSLLQLRQKVFNAGLTVRYQTTIRPGRRCGGRVEQVGQYACVDRYPQCRLSVPWRSSSNVLRGSSRRRRSLGTLRNRATTSWSDELSSASNAATLKARNSHSPLA